MDFKKKYLKYKNKYLNQKKILKGSGENTKLESDSYKQTLKELYPKCLHDSSTVRTDKLVTETYGEMEYEGIESLCKKLKDEFKEDNFNIFLDIGSGRGKLPLWFASCPDIEHSIGVEIVEERHTYALELKNKLSKEYRKFTEKVDLIHGDINNIFSEIKTKLENKKTLVWISNLCFGETLTQNIFNTILNELNSGTIICCSREPKGIEIEVRGNTNSGIPINMSWSANSNVFIYEIKDNKKLLLL